MAKRELIYGMMHPTSLLANNYSYSLNGEDIIVGTLLEGVKNGFYVDIGAHHPFFYSNTLRFYLNGWRGLNVDAMPGSMKSFNRVRKRDINVEAGISDTGEMLKFYVFEEKPLNTFDKGIAERNINTGHKLKKVLDVQTYNVMEILDRYIPHNQKIDFMDIDIEGFDDMIIRQIDWEKYRPTVVMAEMNYKDMKPNQLLLDLGYELKTVLINTAIYMKV